MYLVLPAPFLSNCTQFFSTWVPDVAADVGVSDQSICPVQGPALDAEHRAAHRTAMTESSAGDRQDRTSIEPFF